MMTALKDAAAKIHDGERTYARNLLRDYLKTNPEDTSGWVLAARAAKTERQAQALLERALAIDPLDDRAAVALQRLAHSKEAQAARRAFQQAQRRVAFLRNIGLVLMVVGVVIGAAAVLQVL